MSKVTSWYYKDQTVKVLAGKDINSTTYECTITVPKGIIRFNTFSRKVMRRFIDKEVA